MRQFSKQNQPAKTASVPFARIRSASPEQAHAPDQGTFRIAAPAGFDFSRIPVHGKTPVGIQTKLTIGAAGDAFEQEADRVAEQVMRMPESIVQSQVLSQQPVAPTAPLQAKSSLTSGNNGVTAPPIVHDALNSPGQPLDVATRTFMEPRFGHDFSKVRVHTDARAAQAARRVNALAYTAGRDVVFAAGRHAPQTIAGRRLLAHELTHVIQQSAGGAVGCIQRYEAGEHARFGETGAELKALIDAPKDTYTVKRGDSPASIAAAFDVPQSDLIKRNKAKVKQFPARDDNTKTVAGFLVGEQIEIPKVLNPAMREARDVGELSYEAGKSDAAGNRARVKYGEGIAMGGDLFGDPGQIDRTEKGKIEKLQTLIQGEKTSVIQSEKTGTPKKFVDTPEWQAATDKRFIDLAAKNESHFAPSDPALVTPAAGSAGAANKSEWEKYHTEALHSSQRGEKDKALQVNAFADHFLTDAFSAGHLINKLDVMEKFKGGIKTTTPDPKKPAEKKIDPASRGFFQKLADLAFVGDVKKLFSQYEQVEIDLTTLYHHWNIEDADKFRTVLEGVYTDPTGQGQDIVLGAVAKVAHDELSTRPGGVPVENAKGDKWPLSGDRTLNPKTLEIGRKAVAQSQYNVLSVFKTTLALNLTALFKAVWDYVPRPTGTSAADIKAIVDKDTDPSQASLINALAGFIKENYKLMLDKLVALKKLRKA
jgi:LysM repeat protein